MSNTTNHYSGKDNPQYRHGMTNAPEFRAYIEMIRRCCNSNRKAYKNYGGRGIKVCPQWLESFEQFYADVGPRPTSQHSLDRDNNDGDYTPENCRWATSREQANNRRSNRIVCYHGVSMSLAEAVRFSQGRVTRDIAKHRLAKGWPVDLALDVPRMRHHAR